ncbi:MAG: carbohydrate ABC transporter permease [Clostridiales bacterium]|nr:carbohydrate ABC transporter permease [Clostridiales bacterium]
MKIKETPGRIVFRVINTVLLAILAVICVIPLWHVFMSSISDPTDITRHSGLVLWPLSESGPVTLRGYTVVLKNNSIVRGYANTIFYVGTGCVLCIIFSSMAAYCISRRRTMWMKYLTITLTLTMFFNGGLIPTYLVNRALHIVNTRWVVIVMGLISIFYIIIIKTAFHSLPSSLEESAQLDGAGHLTILFKIVLPLTKATIAVIALFYAVAKWNEYLTAAIYLTNRRLYPLQIILREILIESSGVSGVDLSTLGSFDNYKKLIQYSTIIFATLPILCIYPFVQKYFVKGVMIGSIKG